MGNHPKPSRPVLALLVLGSVGCGSEVVREVETVKVETVKEVPVTTTIIREVPAPTPVDPGPAPLDCAKQVYTAQPAIDDSRSAATGKRVITADGKQFKDRSGDGALQPYEDWRLLELCRARDLVGRMTVPQKVALMSEGSTIGSGTADGTVPTDVAARITTGHVRQALMRMPANLNARQLAVYLNNIQELAEKQQWGIPFVVTADPLHGFGLSTHGTTGAQTLNASPIWSPWPYPLGLGAINDLAWTRKHGEVVREEFKAAGFRWQLGPQIDVVTEPRWARAQSNFGENTLHVAKHSKATVEAFQGSSNGDLRNGIAATIKHFPGSAPVEGGMDPHSFPGRYAVFPGGNLAFHLIPFQAAFEANPASMMASYSIYKNQYQWDPLQVPAGFSRGFITELAKDTMGFKGMVTGDWGTATRLSYGLEIMSTAERAALWLQAGSHQFGSDPSSAFQEAYDQGLVTAADIDAAAVKILEMSFKLGIFENAYVDPSNTAAVVRSPAHLQAGFDAQKLATVLLVNKRAVASSAASVLLPLSATRAESDTNGDGKVSVYFDGVLDKLATGGDTERDPLGDYDYTSPADAAAAPARRAVEQAASLATADVAVLRISARKGTYFGLDAGVPLSFDAPFPGTQVDVNEASAVKDRNRVIDALRVRHGYTRADGTAVPAANPTLKIVLVMHMDRPGIVKPFINGLKTLDETAGQPGSYPRVSDEANVEQTATATGVDAFLVEFGAYDRAVLDVVFNRNVPAGAAGYGRARLPMELPSTDAEVAVQFEDVGQDTRNPTFRLGAGINL